jgi:ATP-dependent Clp protease adaptor protein ClpS
MSQHRVDPSPSKHDGFRSRPPIFQRGRQPRLSMPLYKVLLHYDAASDLMVIVHAVMDLTRFCRAEATHRMWQACHDGRSLLLITYKERAELYVEQFAGKGLTVSIEPA